MNNSPKIEQVDDSDIAIIGMALRLPGARSVEQFWRNLCDGVESISFFSDEELKANGIDDALLANPRYVKASGVLDDIASFDASFFGFNPREAEIMDPQHRLFLECSWEALEHAGYNTETYGGRIGVHAGVGFNTYLFNLFSNPELIGSVGYFQTMLGNGSSFLATLASYKLNLKGPSVTVQTACSTSLVAVHLACQSLLNGESDMALAGGSSLSVPQKIGYLYQEGGILSPDGHCRAFDAGAQGTVAGSGVAIVVLKRLSDALADGDALYAIIKGSAINNDGSLKMGYTAPSVTGQAEVITEALTVAGVDPRTVSYVETHGTGTPLGDPIEIAALAQAFNTGARARNFCAIGSVKTNIGHTDTAAGAAGLIKAALVLKHGQIPPSLHFAQPNPAIDFPNTPFYVNTSLSPWPSLSTPRRAAVSSFGIGGTNAHLILEEAPTQERADSRRRSHLLLLSARTDSALEAASLQLGEFLRTHPETSLADVAYTLQVGRRGFARRRMLVCESVEEAVQKLERGERKGVESGEVEGVGEGRGVVFMFSGQGTEYVNMGRELYEGEERFRSEVDRCAESLLPHLGLDLREVIYPGGMQTEQAEARLHETWLTQPALFVIEYAMAQQWQEWGVRPVALIGHSLGEYVAASLAGVFEIEEALALVAARGRLMQQVSGGAMLSVALAEEEVLPLLRDPLCVAAVNAPKLCVVAGPTRAIEDWQQEMQERGVQCRRLRTSHAFHSSMMAEVVEPWRQRVSQVSLGEPRVPYISNVTGHWIAAAEARDAAYWGRHLRQAVRFGAGVEELLRDGERVLLEIGPGRTLSKLVRQQKNGITATVVSSMREAGDDARGGDETQLMRALGQLWLSGVEIDWESVHAGERRQRVPLPTYPFERQRFWVEARRLGLDLNARQTPGPDLPGESVDGGEQGADSAIATHLRPALSNAYVAPGNEIEQRIAELWQELLGIAEVGIHDDFFDLGGHSLLATQIISRIQEEFEVNVPLRSLFQNATVAELATTIENILIEELEKVSEEDAERLLAESF
jgi:phthiocerol/phenolphthiocerol synthesis type-I polyketide synthase E